MIHSSRGAHYMMVNSFTFKKQDSKARTWVCTSRPASKCLAKVRMEDPNTVIPYSLEHNHPPPLYHVMKDGQYIKMIAHSKKFISAAEYGFKEIHDLASNLYKAFNFRNRILNDKVNQRTAFTKINK
ncbi:hypothetical protein ABMA28_001425 [Loxostege sticticalis]|uniref:FLYWCH-type domain-containing protein n=1 Tax=Loxostege sticticalis TaxID=481309 RepID=A0ABD0T1M5_LOXSC